MHVVIAVEKFDYAKGLPQKLRAIRKYLEQRDSAADTVFLHIYSNTKLERIVF